jgi:hypothetical protein
MVEHMDGLYSEQRSIGNGVLTQDLARHIYTRMHCGPIAIVADNPVSLLAALRKQWLGLGRKALRERASTLSTTRILEFSYTIPRMQSLRFSATPPPDNPDADVHIATPADFTTWPPQCRTIYILTPHSPLTPAQLATITSHMPIHSRAVQYL